MDNISFYVNRIDDVSVTDNGTLDVELSGIDISQIVIEVGFENLIDEMDLEEVKAYITEKESKTD